MLDSGFRISDLSNIPVNGKDGKFKNRIAFDNTYLLSYAHTVYGINYNKHNYKIPLTAIRDDIKGYVGIESLVAPWSEQLKLWHGYWHNPSIRNKSYVYQWDESDKLHEHYAPKKFEDLENSYFIIKDAPYPFESGKRNNGEIAASTTNNGTPKTINMPIAESDPYPDSNKIVTKSYIDERLAGERIIEVEPTFEIRDYECTYIIRSEILKNKGATIKIRFPEKFEDRICHNKLKFTLMLEGKANNNSYESSLSKNPNWIFEDSSGNIINVVWLNANNNTPPDVTDSIYYDNSRYFIIRFETVTSELLNKSITKTIENQLITTGYKVTPNYGVFAFCENILYRSTGITTPNFTSTDNSVSINHKGNTYDFSVDIPEVTIPSYNFTSTDNSVNIDYDGNTYDFSVAIPETLTHFKTFIKELESTGINFNESYNTKYWKSLTSSSLKINFSSNGLENNETASTELLCKSSTDFTITSDNSIIWVSSTDNAPPTLKANYLYLIEFSYYPLSGTNLSENVVYARIKWFKKQS